MLVSKPVSNVMQWPLKFQWRPFVRLPEVTAKLIQKQKSRDKNSREFCGKGGWKREKWNNDRQFT